MLSLSFLLQCVTAIVWNETMSMFYCSKAKLSSSVWPSGHAVPLYLSVPSRGADHQSAPSSFPFVFSTRHCHFNISALSEEVHRGEQKKFCALSGVHSEYDTCCEWVLLCTHTAHCTYSFSCLFFLSDPSKCSHPTPPHHPPQCKSRPYHCGWWVQTGVFSATVARCYSSLWRTGGSSLCERAVRTLSNFS